MRKSITIFTIVLLVLFMVGCENTTNPMQSENQLSGERSLEKKGGGNKGGNELDVIAGESIQAAIDLALDGDIIKVGPGTYNEELVIDGKDISLIAVGDVTIQPPLPYSSGNSVTIKNGKVTINGFKVDAINRYSGITVIGKVDDGEVFADILNNTVYGFAKNAITVAYVNAYGNVIGNTTNGRGPVGSGYWAQNGIQVSYGAKGKVMDNVVNGVWYTGDDWGATGILIFETDNVLIHQNTVSDCEMGIAVQAWGWRWPTANYNRIIKNSVNDCEWAISIAAYDLGGYSQQDAFAINNKITNNIIDATDGLVGVEVFAGSAWGGNGTTPTADNNKVIHNTISGYEYELIDDGSINSKIHANVF